MVRPFEHHRHSRYRGREVFSTLSSFLYFVSLGILWGGTAEGLSLVRSKGKQYLRSFSTRQQTIRRISYSRIHPTKEEKPIVEVPEIEPPVKVEPEIGDFNNEVESPSCSCDCCAVVRRLPADIPKNGQEFKCGVDPNRLGQSHCAAVCDPKQRGKQVLDNAEIHGTPIETYCLLECKMTDNDVGSPCVRLSYEERAAQTTEGGNGQDDGLPPEAIEVSIPKKVAPSPPPPPEKGLSSEEVRDAQRVKDLADAAKDALDAAATANAR